MDNSQRSVVVTALFAIVDDGRINFSDFCKLMQQQHQQPLPSDDTMLPERDTRQVFRVNVCVYFNSRLMVEAFVLQQYRLR